MIEHPHIGLEGDMFDNMLHSQEPFRVDLSRVPSLRPAFDKSGTVDFADFLVLSANFGMSFDPADHTKGDIDCDGQMDYLDQPYHQAILNNEIPFSIGGGIGQSRTMMSLLHKAHLGEVSVTVWPQILKDICAERNIFVLE